MKFNHSYLFHKFDSITHKNLSREMFTDATRAMAVGGGEKDNKKALAQRKKQVIHKKGCKRSFCLA